MLTATEMKKAGEKQAFNEFKKDLLGVLVQHDYINESFIGKITINFNDGGIRDIEQIIRLQ